MIGDYQEAQGPEKIRQFLPRYFSVPGIIRVLGEIARTICLKCGVRNSNKEGNWRIKAPPLVVIPVKTGIQ